MNKFKKYCPNVWVAECEEEYEKGDKVLIKTWDEMEEEFGLVDTRIVI